MYKGIYLTNMAKVTINIPNIGNIEADNAASEDTLLKILAAIQKAEKKRQQDDAASADKLKKARTEETKQITESNEAIKDSNKSAKQKQADDKKINDANKKSADAWSTRLNQTGQALGGLAGNLAMSFGALISQIASSYTEMAQNPIGASAGLLNSGIDLARNAVHGFADAAKGITSGIPIIGGFVGGLSEAAKAAADFAATLAKIANDIFAKEFQKSVEVLKSYTQAGASFAGGMREMREMANRNSLSMKTLSDAAQKSAASLDVTGLTQGEAVRVLANGMGAAARTIGKSGANLRSEMLALGYSYEEQGEIMASFMAQQRAAGKNLKNIAPEILAKETADYAQNLKVISDITGQDAKKLMEKARAESMRAGLMGKLDEKQRLAFTQANSALSKFGPEVQNALTQFMTLGVVTDPAIAANKELIALIQDTAANVKVGDEKIAAHTADRMKIAQDNLRKDQAMQAVGTAAIAGATGTAGQIAKVADTVLAAQIGSGTESDKVAEKQRNLAGQLGSTEQAFVRLTDQSQKFAAQMEALVGSNLGTYANILAKTQAEAMAIMYKVIAAGGDIKKLAEDQMKDPESLVHKLLSPKVLIAAAAVIGGTVVGGALIKSIIAKKMIGERGPTGAVIEAVTAAPTAPGGPAIGGPTARGVSAGAKISNVMGGLGRGIGAIGRRAGEAVEGVLSKISSGLVKLSSPTVFAGIAALGLLSGAVWVSGKAFKEFSNISWEDVSKGMVSLLGVGALGALAGPLSGFIAAGAAALGLLGGAIWVLGAALKGFPTGILPDMSGSFKEVGEIARGVVGSISTAAKWLQNTVESAFKSIGNFLSDFWQGTKNVFGTAWDVISWPFKKIGEVATAAFDSLSDSMSGLWESTKNAFGAIWDVISWPFIKLGEVVVSAAETVGGLIGSALDNIDSLLRGFLDTTRQVFGFVWDVVKWPFVKIGEVVEATFDGIVNLINDPFKFIEGVFSDFLTGVRTIFNTTWAVISWPFKKIKENAASSFNFVTGTIGKASSFIKNTFSTALSSVKTIFGTVWDVISWPFKKIGEIVVSSFDRVGGIIGRASDFIKGIFSGLLSNVKTIFGSVWDVISAPFKMIGGVVSSAFNNIGEMMLVLWKNIKDVFGSIPNPFAAIRNFAGTAFTYLKSGAEQVGEVFSRIFGGIGDIVTSVFTGIKNFFGDIIEFVKSIGEKIMRFGGAVVESAKKIFGVEDKKAPTTAAPAAGAVTTAATGLSEEKFVAAVDKFSSIVDKFISITGPASANTMATPKAIRTSSVKNLDMTTVDSRPITKRDLSDLMVELQRQTKSSDLAKAAAGDKTKVFGATETTVDPVDRLHAKLSEIADLHKEQLGTHKEMVDHMRDHKNISTRILHASV